MVVRSRLIENAFWDLKKIKKTRFVKMRIELKQNFWKIAT